MEQLIEEYHRLSVLVYEEWLKTNLWTWRWWLMVALAILPWIFWLIVRKRESTWRLLCAGFFSLIISSLLDIVGQAMGLWQYQIKVIPLMPPFLPWDFCALPVVTMLFIQFFPRENPYAKGAVYAVGGAFIFQPLTIWLGLYQEKNWSHFYSLPILFAIYLVSHWIANRKKYERI